MPNVISVFDGEKYGFLSNFYICDVIYNGIHYKHTEGAFQAQKTLNKDEQEYIATLTPGQAKRACGRRGLNGFSIKLRPDWEEVKNNVMYEVVKAKFEQNPDLKEKLLATGETELIEGNTWHDNYWGDCVCHRCFSIDGHNQLGKTLMRVREELRG